MLTYKVETEEATVPQIVDVSDNNPHEESDNGGNVPTDEMPRNSEEHSDTLLSSVISPTHQVSGSQQTIEGGSSQPNNGSKQFLPRARVRSKG